MLEAWNPYSQQRQQFFQLFLFVPLPSFTGGETAPDAELRASPRLEVIHALCCYLNLGERIY